MRPLSMKLPSISSPGLADLAGISLVTPALAVVNIDYVNGGNARNAADTTFDSPGYGAVS